MSILIDCYNLLHAPMPPRLAGMAEGQLCMLLASSQWRRRMVVVCDGMPKPLGLIESPTDAVELVYSGVGRTADSVIMQMVVDDSAPKRLIVVSNDREIQKAARRRRARVWSCETFIHELLKGMNRGGKAADTPPAPAKQQGPLGDEEVDRWLERFGVDGEERLDGDGGAVWWDAGNGDG